MKPQLQQPTWAGPDWPERSEKAMSLLSLLIEPELCGCTLDKYFAKKPSDRLFKDLALILLGNDLPHSVKLVSELTLVNSGKCECKECVFHQIEMV